MKALIILGLCVFSATVVAQQAQWQKTYGGAGFEDAHVVHEILGEGYIVMGTSSSSGNGSNDCMMLKIDLEGNEIWMKTYGGNGDEDSHYGIITNDGGFAMISYSNSFGSGDYDFYLIRTDGNGDTLWTKTYGDSLDQLGYCLQETTDGGFIMVGKAVRDSTGYLDIWMIKADSTGTIEWEQYYGDSLDDYARFVELTGDGGYILTGTTHNTDSGEAELYLVKTDGLGNLEWEKRFYGNEHTFGYSVQQTMLGDYVVSGYMYDQYYASGTYYNILVLKTDNFGNELWRKSPFSGGGAPNTHVSHSIRENSDGTYLLCGGTYVEVVCKTSMDPDTGLYISNMLLLRINADGSTAEYREVGMQNGMNELGTYGVQTSDGGFVFCAYQGYDYQTDGQAYVVKTDADFNYIKIGIDSRSKLTSAFSVFPNPSSDRISIKIDGERMGVYTIFDASGRKVISGTIKGANTEVNTKALNPGCYNVAVDFEEGRYNKNLIITE
ncbi:MAG: T9SS type A sorting domain-containing protein [Flavobacteriales bacterium]|nr:T9SS type A sorting domain-containing protein [Flavobacteriales bacterium]